MKNKKIINDPVHGFIPIPEGLIYEVLEHPIVQRLRRVKQLGMTDLVYPGAQHSRFHHAIGAMSLMHEALKTLKSKGVAISKDEMTAGMLAVLLHDVGHGPFSHALEFKLVSGVSHEKITLGLMELLNTEFKGDLSLAIEMFKGTYSRSFFCELISSQLDVDRLDYLQRDSFYTGVQEGVIGGKRIIRMLNVIDDNLLVEEKGIYSIERFLTARRFMYWQVYLHKTALSVEKMLVSILERARTLVMSDSEFRISKDLRFFLENDFSNLNFLDTSILQSFINLDDFDIFGVIKLWAKDSDKILQLLASMLLERRLFHCRLTVDANYDDLEREIKPKVREVLDLTEDELKYFIVKGRVSNKAYVGDIKSIKLLRKNGDVVDLEEASDLPNISVMTKIVKKDYLCWPKIVNLSNISTK